jgi:hypothetical protein
MILAISIAAPLAAILVLLGVVFQNNADHLKALVHEYLGPRKQQKQTAEATTNREQVGVMIGNLDTDQPPTRQNAQQAERPPEPFVNNLKRQIRKPRFWIEIGALGAVVYYACIAAHQLSQMRQTVRQAIAANQLARDNAALELRAYVSVQAEHGDAVKLVQDPKTNETRVSISFYNAGQTPAHNFRDAFATGGVSKSTGSFNGDQIQRFQFVGKGPFSGGRSGGGGPDIPARSAHTEYLPIEQMPTEKEWDEIRTGKKTFFTIWGDYEYCDEFGGYHCRMLQFDYHISPQMAFVPSTFMDMDCLPKPVVPPDEPASVKVLRRCRQPEEEKESEKYADSNAGKVFPAHTGKSESGRVQFNGVTFPTATPTK